MGYAERHTVTLTANSGGAATGYTPNVTGRIVSIQYVKAGSGAFADGVDFVVSGDETGLAIWTGTNVNNSATVYPVAAAVVPSGSASTLTERPIVLVNERIKIVVAEGGNGGTGTLHIVVE